MDLVVISQTLFFMFLSFATSVAIICFAVEDEARDEDRAERQRQMKRDHALAEAIRRLRHVEVQQ